MKKTLTTAQVRNIGAMIFQNWEKNKNDIKLNGKSLYNLIALKKNLEQKLIVIEETIMALGTQYGGEVQQDGSLIIPPESRQEANAAFSELGEETVEIEYGDIKIEEDSHLPIDIYEAIFDFINLTE